MALDQVHAQILNEEYVFEELNIPQEFRMLKSLRWRFEWSSARGEIEFNNNEIAHTLPEDDFCIIIALLGKYLH